jgi:hypothetical protein
VMTKKRECGFELQLLNTMDLQFLGSISGK